MQGGMAVVNFRNGITPAAISWTFLQSCSYWDGVLWRFILKDRTHGNCTGATQKCEVNIFLLSNTYEQTGVLSLGPYKGEHSAATKYFRYSLHVEIYGNTVLWEYLLSPCTAFILIPVCFFRSWSPFVAKNWIRANYSIIHEFSKLIATQGMNKLTMTLTRVTCT